MKVTTSAIFSVHVHRSLHPMSFFYVQLLSSTVSMNKAQKAVCNSSGNPCPSFDDTLMLLIEGYSFSDNNNKKCVILACIDLY